MNLARQLAQAVLDLALIGYVVRLLLAAMNDHQPDAPSKPPRRPPRRSS
jgi:hypothetical protein